MREIFLEYAKQGAMTSEELAGVLRRKKTWVVNNSGSGKLIPRLPGYPIRFDPNVMLNLFCPVEPTARSRSLTIEGHKTGAKTTIEGFRKCL